MKSPFCRISSVLLLCLGGLTAIFARQAAAQEPLPESLTSMDPLQAGQLLAERLRSSTVAEESSEKGVLKIRQKPGETISVPFRFELRPMKDGWEATYETGSVGNTPAEKLQIVHCSDRTNQYLFAVAAKPGEGPGQPRPIPTSQAARPLANSDFWLTDLGLEFAYWPKQKLLEGKMRKSRFCYALESTPPKPTEGYSRVVSWIDRESGGIISAEAYDLKGKLLKEFEVSHLQKVKGRWELQEIEMTNVQTNSRTRLEFERTQK